MTTITQGAALRIALAARVLEGVDTKAFTQWVVKKLGPVNEAALGLTVTDLKRPFPEKRETAIFLSSPVRYLWGEDVDVETSCRRSLRRGRARPAACGWRWRRIPTRTRRAFLRAAPDLSSVKSARWRCSS
jgi:hypothetical protein